MGKNYFSKLKLSALLLVSAMGFSQSYVDGVFVLNEGGAGSGNASVSFISNTTGLTNGIYDAANGGGSNQLGDTAQSMFFEGDKGYIVLNISNSLKIVERTSLHLITEITNGLTNPRYMAAANGKGYVTCWGDGVSTTDDYIAIIDLATNTLTGTIPASAGVERIQLVNGKLYVANMGGYGWGTTVTVINPNTDTVETNITVGDVPQSMVQDGDFLYVLCAGKPSWSGGETAGKLVKVNLADNSVVSTIDFPNFPILHPQHLRTDGNGYFYYSIDGDIFKMDIASTTPAETPLCSLGEQNQYGLYGMDVIDGKIYAADAVDYFSPGLVSIFATDGAHLIDYNVGIIPNSFYKAANSLAVDQASADAFVVYPNPASDTFYIASNQPVSKVTLVDVSGRVVKSVAYGVEGVSVSGLQSGIYLAEITDGTSTQVKRIVIR